MQKKILIVDDYDDVASILTRKFAEQGHQVKTIENRDDAVELMEDESFDLIITDLHGEELIADETENEDVCLPETEDARSTIKAFKICVTHYENEESEEADLKKCIETTLNVKAKCVDKKEFLQDRHEKIEFEIPSVISLMHSVLDYLIARVGKLGVINPETSNLFVALDEAFVNAVKHGNKFDTKKLVRITAEVSSNEARFTIEDEGEGFNVTEIPDPRNPENLFKSSGRGVLFIYNIMDEVKYNERGNRLTMIKRSENRRESKQEVS